MGHPPGKSKRLSELIQVSEPPTLTQTAAEFKPPGADSRCKSGGGRNLSSLFSRITRPPETTLRRSLHHLHQRRLRRSARTGPGPRVPGLEIARNPAPVEAAPRTLAATSRPRRSAGTPGVPLAQRWV